jgi:hypothetical protein
MKRFLPLGVALAGSVLAIATVLVLRTGAPAVKRLQPAWRHALAEGVDDISDRIEEALE